MSTSRPLHVENVAAQKLESPGVLTSLPKVIWEEGRVAAVSHTYAAKSPLATVAQIRSQKYPSSGPIPKPRYLPHAWIRPTYDAKRHPDPIRHFPQCTGQTDRPTVARTYVRTDRQIVHGKV